VEKNCCRNKCWRLPFLVEDGVDCIAIPQSNADMLAKNPEQRNLSAPVCNEISFRRLLMSFTLCCSIFRRSFFVRRIKSWQKKFW